MPPPLEDMADSIKLKQRLNATSAKVASKKAVREGKATPKPAPAPVKGPGDGIWLKRAVMLEGLSAKHYNGQTGVCISWDQEKGELSYLSLSLSKEPLQVVPAPLERTRAEKGCARCGCGDVGMCNTCACACACVRACAGICTWNGIRGLHPSRTCKT